MTELTFSIRHERDGPILSVVGELDLETRDTLRDQLAALTGRVSVDLTHVTFLDSSAIAVLVATHNRLTADHGELRLLNPQEVPRHSLELLGLAPLID
jgi:anti-anti-sigma factor